MNTKSPPNFRECSPASLEKSSLNCTVAHRGKEIPTFVEPGGADRRKNSVCSKHWSGVNPMSAHCGTNWFCL
jgi:hypothetical protein